MMPPRVAFHDLPVWDFPMTIELIAEDNGEVLFQETVTGPAALVIPACAPRKVMTRTTTPRRVLELDSSSRVVRDELRGYE